ncbi:uncharacterized protein LOC126770243 isoform X1 [Nymphalis io]|uniref:uncharacterized protein LOC126770243 isoform X1 n=1 Tax=Inachis io TaxID=171585 RepID=UPI00216748A0|nr:uncharacterized protein LOC126770243 isoform X1 [Nymphalis io]
MSAIRGPPSSPTLMQESCAELRSELNFAASEIDHEAGESSSKLIVQRATGVRCGASCGACPSVASLPFGGGRRPRARGRGRGLVLKVEISRTKTLKPKSYRAFFCDTSAVHIINPSNCFCSTGATVELVLVNIPIFHVFHCAVISDAKEKNNEEKTNE